MEKGGKCQSEINVRKMYYRLVGRKIAIFFHGRLIVVKTMYNTVLFLCFCISSISCTKINLWFSVRKDMKLCFFHYEICR